MNRSSWWSLLVVIPLLGLISDRSGYSIVGGVDSINLDIALMLTPWGLIHNWFIVQDHYLQPYYFETSARSDLYQDPVLLTLLIATTLTSIGSLYWMRKNERRS